jgi:DNA-binding transcriptional regulator GbsR (MarR family)
MMVFFISATVLAVNAQTDASNRSPGSNQKEDLPKGIKESLAKQRIEREKKDFADLLKRGEEALKLTDELKQSFAQNNTFSIEDQKKLDRLEKVVKKIRNEIGGDDGDEQAEDKPLSILSALKTLQSNTIKLVDELKKTSRYSISVVLLTSNLSF